MRILCKGCLREVDVSDAAQKPVCPYCRKPLDKPKPEHQTKVNSSVNKPSHQSSSSDYFVLECPVCQSKYKLPSNKIPRDKSFKIKCRNCGGAIVSSFASLSTPKANNPDSSPEFKSIRNSHDESKIDDPKKTQKLEIFQSNSQPQGDDLSSSQDDLSSLRASVKKPVSYLIINTEGKFGPMTLTEVRKWAEQGFLKKNDSVRKDKGEFRPAWHLPELRPFLKILEDTKVSSVKEITEKQETWTLYDLILGVSAGLLGGLLFSVLPIVISFLQSIPIFDPVFTPRQDLNLIQKVLVQLAFWLVLGGFQGSLFAFLEAFTSFRSDSVDIWRFQNVWIGLVVGTVLGALLTLLNVMQAVQIIVLAINFTVMTLIIIFSYTKIKELQFFQNISEKFN